jgi:hypothetical protein
MGERALGGPFSGFLALIELAERPLRSDLSTAYRDWKRAKQQNETSEIFRPDGSINYGPAIKSLLERIAVLEEEVASLKRQHFLPV